MASLLLAASSALSAQTDFSLTGNIKHVLLVSIDGMHSVDLANCTQGLASINGGYSYCPNLAQLSQSGVVFNNALTTRPSDSFPGLVAQITGGTPRTAGMYYDVSYDRALSPPAATTPYGIVGGANLCPSMRGTQVGFDEEIDFDYTKIDGAGGINPMFLPRDPNNNCAPVYPHNFIRTNTIFEVVRNAMSLSAVGGYTAWSDKHPSYDFVNGPSGKGVSDFYSPEINSVPVALPAVPGCSPLPDPGAAASSNAWTDSFQNIQCYDELKVQAVLNWINAKSHDGSTSAPVPNLFGMNFQSVSVGQKLVEGSLNLTGGYLDAAGTPTASLLSEIQFVDNAIGEMKQAIEGAGLADSTVIIVSAKHGQSPIDPNRVNRIPADFTTGKAPSDVLGGIGTGLVGGGLVGQADEDDVSLLWLTDPTKVASSVATLQQNEATYGGGELFWGNSLANIFGSPRTDSRVPDIAIAPNVGVTYTGGKKKIAEHGGFSNDDRNVLLLVSNDRINPAVVNSQVETRQIAPTVLKLLGLDPNALQAVREEGTEVLPALPY
jgi:hypothetical protein